MLLSKDALALANKINANFTKGDKPIVLEPKMDLDVLPTGSIELDRAIGVYGYPFGRVTEIFGAESSGKSTLALTACKYAQRMGIIPTYIDVEYALDMNYVTQLGVDTSNLIIVQPEFAEKALEVIEYAALDGSRLIILDSIGHLLSRRETQEESGMEDNQIGRVAYLLSKSLRRLTPILKRTNTCVIMLNQMRSKIGGMPGMPTDTTPGGKVLLHMGSVRLKITKVAKDTGEDPSFIESKVVVVKNKVAPPLKDIRMKIGFGTGIDVYSELIDLLIEAGIVKKSGSWFVYGEKKIQGMDKFIDLIKDDESFRKELLDKCSFPNKEEYF